MGEFSYFLMLVLNVEQFLESTKRQAWFVFSPGKWKVYNIEASSRILILVMR